MAAQVIGPGDFLLEVAQLGQNLTTSLLKLNIALIVSDKDLDRLLGAISVATSILIDLGTTINEHREDVYIGNNVTRPRAEMYKSDLEKLLVLSKKASEQILLNRELALSGKAVAAVIDIWKSFRAELGSREEFNDFFSRIETTPGYLLTLNDTIKYKIYKALEKQNRLDVEQAFELQRIISVLPKLVCTIERAVGRQKALRLSADTKKYLDALEDETFIYEEALRKPTIQRNDSFATSDFTVFDTNQDKREDLLDIRTRNIRKDPQAEDDRYSLLSTDSFQDRRVQSHDSDFLDIKEVFEQWTIRWYKESKQLLNTKSLFGIHVKDYQVNRAVWAKIPELGSQDELRNAYLLMTADLSESKYRASVMKAIKTLPRQAREALEVLVEERERATNNLKFKRQWSVVAVQARTRHQYGGGSLFKSDKSQEWLIMLKGETVGQVDRKQPDWWYDPWIKPRTYHRGRRQTPAYRSHPENRRDRMERPYRSPSPLYDADRRERSYSPVIRERNPISSREDRRYHKDTVPERYPPATTTVDEKAKMEDAEKKMEELVKDLPGCFAP